MRDPRSVLITGASSGIGAALAEAYAAPGIALALGGRDGERLDAVAARCRAKGAQTTTEQADVTDASTMATWVREADRRAPLDLVIANAGISAGTGGGGESDAQARRIFAVNVDGLMNTVLPAIPPLRVRRRGQIALMSSVAAFLGFPGAPAYCASKACVRTYGEALRALLGKDGVEVTVICPGFVRTPMSAMNPFPMPFLMDAGPAAALIKRGLAQGRARIAFPWPMVLAVKIMAALPAALRDPLLARLPEKASAAPESH